MDTIPKPKIYILILKKTSVQNNMAAMTLSHAALVYENINPKIKTIMIKINIARSNNFPFSNKNRAMENGKTSAKIAP